MWNEIALQLWSSRKSKYSIHNIPYSFCCRTYDPSKGCNTDSIQYVDAYRTNICINSYITSVFVNDTTVTQYELADCRGSISVQYDYNVYNEGKCNNLNGMLVSIALYKPSNEFSNTVGVFRNLFGAVFIGSIAFFIVITCNRFVALRFLDNENSKVAVEVTV